MSDEMIKRIVMRRVYAIYWWRRLTASPLSKMGLLAVFLGTEMMLISVVDVVQNARGLSGFDKMIGYFFRAFTGTELTVQAISLGTFLVVILAGRDLLRRGLPFRFSK